MENTNLIVLGIVFVLSLLMACIQFLRGRRAKPTAISEGRKVSAAVEKHCQGMAN